MIYFYFWSHQNKKNIVCKVGVGEKNLMGNELNFEELLE